MKTVALTAGEYTAKLFLICAGKIETRQVGTGIDIAPPHADEVVAAGNYLINALIGIDILVLLVHIGYFYGLSYLELATIGRIQPHNKAEKGGFTRSVRTNNAYNTIRRQHEVKVVKQEFVAKSFCYMLSLNNLVAQTGTVGDEDFELLFFLLHVFVQQFVVRVQTGFSLCLTGFGSHTHPLQLAFQRLAAFAGSLFFLLHALGLLFEPAGVVAFPGNTFATIEFKYPACHMVKEVPVVSYSNYRTFVLLQVLLQPVDGFGIKVVGRLIEEQYVGLLKQQTTERHTTAFTTGKMFYRLVFGWTTKRIHRTLQLTVKIPGIGSVNDVLQLRLTGEELVHLVLIFVVFGQSELLIDFLVLCQRIYNGLYAFHHHFFHCLRGIEVRLLSQISYRISGREHHFALIGFVQAGDNLQQGRFTRTVQTDDTDFRSVEERKVDVLQHLLIVLLNGLVQPYHRKDNFLIVYCCHVS